MMDAMNIGAWAVGPTSVFLILCALLVVAALLVLCAVLLERIERKLDLLMRSRDTTKS